MSVPSFIFSDDKRTGAMSAAELKRNRAVAQALLEKSVGSTPRNVGEGLNALGQAILYRSQMAKLDKAEGDLTEAQSGLWGKLTGGGAASPGLPSAPASPSAVSAALNAGAAPSTTAAASADFKPVDISGDKDTFVSSLMPAAIEASKRTGIDPRIIVAQGALESGWGKSAPGNNLFGIKSHGKEGGNTLSTMEEVGGKMVPQKASFRAYATPAESVNGYADFMTENPRYRGMREAQGLDAQIEALQASGYATDSNYGAKIRAIANSLPMPTMPNTATNAADAITQQMAPQQVASADPSFMPQDPMKSIDPSKVNGYHGPGSTISGPEADAMLARQADENAMNPNVRSYSGPGSTIDPREMDRLGGAPSSPQALPDFLTDGVPPTARPVEMPPGPLPSAGDPKAAAVMAALAGQAPGVQPPMPITPTTRANDPAPSDLPFSQLSPVASALNANASPASAPPGPSPVAAALGGQPPVPALPPAQNVGANPVPPQISPVAAALGGFSPQIQQAAAADPSFDGFAQNTGAAPAPAQAGGGMPDQQTLISVLSSPIASDEQKQVAGMLLEQQMKQNAPMTRAEQMAQQKFEYEQKQDAATMKSWQKLDDTTLFNPMTGETKSIAPTGGAPTFTGSSVEAQALNGLINTGAITRDQALQLGAGKTVTGPNGELLFMTPQGVFGQNAQGGAPQPVGQPSNAQPQASGDQQPGMIPLTEPKVTIDEKKAMTFADRMSTSGAIIDSMGMEGSGFWDRTLNEVPVAGEYMTSDAFKKVDQARRDFINAQLRRESGAVISPEEFDSANKQYFPQPDDPPEIVAQKKANRELVINGMVRDGGPTYSPPQAGKTPDLKTKYGLE